MPKYLCLTIFLALTVVTFISGSAWSCQCIWPQTPDLGLQRSKIVFSGKVLEFVFFQKKYYSQTKFKVERIWKGKVGETVFIITGSGLGDCGYYFKKGEKYIVYAIKGNKGVFYTDTCTRTALLEDAEDDLAVLGAGKKPRRKQIKKSKAGEK